MSEINHVSPLLDNFTLGNPISEHDGVVCRPAIRENSDKKYIIKIISIPATQAQLDALLLAGAYKDPADAMEYFRETGEDILNEAECLKNLSKLEGFLPYEGWQMVPITRRRLGYEIYLVGSYKRSLDKYMKKNAITHLEALNLGLDLCTALSVCRQAGYLYVDLKPQNIYVSGKKEYRIGDLGFLPLDSLRYASLPSRYYSAYTAPELLDPMSSVNLTADTYAVGMILYQLYNDGQLPKVKNHGDPLPMPVNADYEMAEIIMKAIHPEPDQRWDDPKDLGKALASYMQRNTVNDVPITPFTPLDVKPEDIVPIVKKQDTQEDAQLPEEETAAQDHEDNTAPVQNEQDGGAPAIIAEQENPDIEPEIAETETEDAPQEAEASIEINGETEDGPESNGILDEVSEDVSEQDPPVQEEGEPDLSEENEESVPDAAEEEQVEDTLELSEELSRMISKADELIAHEIPEDTLFPEEPELPDPFAFVEEEEETIDEMEEPEDPLIEEENQKATKKKKNKSFVNPEKKKKRRKFFSRVFLLLILGVLAAGGYWYYQNAYLQSIDALTIEGSQNEITVLIDTDVEESMLTVTCSDNYGKVHSGVVSGGKVVFTDLDPSTLYTVEVEMEGFHKLTGKTSGVFTTESTTQIVSFTAVAGSEDGSVLLNFTVDGDEPDFWNIRYTADGEDVMRETITNHSTMITGLTIGKLYTFQLDGGNQFDLGGETTLEYLASRLILADNIVINSAEASEIVLTWNTPGDAVVESWNVRCFNDDGFDEQVIVTENEAKFTGIDPTLSYEVEITASGMTQPSKTVITPDPIHVSAFHMDESAHTEMKVTWDHEGNEPEGGWTLIYTVDGSGNQVVKCDGASAVIAPLIPGAKYHFELQAADGRTVFNNAIDYAANPAEFYTDNGVVLADFSINLLKTPAEDGWYAEDISNDAFTTTFAPGDSVSIALRSSSAFYLPGYETKVLYVFRDGYGNVLPEMISEEVFFWKNIWLGGDPKNGELTIPKLPTVPGSYVMELYFNGRTVAEFDITIG